jgi:signal transduction histidine kinase
LRLLLIEASDGDAELVRRVLWRSGFDLQITRVADEAALIDALAQTEHDLVISDYQLPALDALAALAVVRASHPDLPFIVVSGRTGEDVAVDVVRRGANDYLLKQSLARLPLAVERELREAAQRRERAHTREQTIISERLSTIATIASGLVHEINNPLAAMTANLHCAAESLARAEASWCDADAVLACLRALREPVAELQAACAIVGTIASDMKVFARSADARDGETNLANVIASAERVARFAFRSRARFVRDFQPVPRAKGDPARLAQVFLILILNAAQSIPEGDVLHHEIRALLREDEGGCVRVEIHASASGPAGDSPSAGIARAIVEACGGEMDLERAPGGGTIARMRFAAASAHKTREHPAVAAELEAPPS